MKRLSNDNEKLVRVIFNHINYLPEKQIENSTLLFSRGEESTFAFKYLSQKQRPPNANYPSIIKLKEGEVVIDPTKTFLSPQIENQFNFVTMHYLMRVVKNAKFVFVFDHSDTIQHPLNNIGTTLKIFISLFRHVSDNQWQQICKSSSIWITEARKCDNQVYYQRLVGSNYDGFLLENYSNPNQNKFFKDPKDMQRVAFLLKDIIVRQRIIFTKIQDKDTQKIAQNFLKLTNTQKFYKMERNMRLNLKSSYEKWVGLNISNLWREIFQDLYQNIDLLATDPQQENYLFKKMDPYSRRQDKYFQVKTDQQQEQIFKSVKYLKIIYGMIQIADQIRKDNHDIFDMSKNQIIVNKFLSMLYQSKIINHPFIKVFMKHFFLIYEFMFHPEGLSNNPQAATLFQKVQFLQIYSNQKIFNPKLKSISTKLIQYLQKDLQKHNDSYPYQQCFQILKKIVELKQIVQYTFLTDRIVKKLQKGLVKIIQHQIKSSKKQSKEILRYKLNFLEESRELQLIPIKEKIQIGISLVKQLVSKREITEKAVKLLQYLPVIYNINEITKIYESNLKLNVQYLKYMSENERNQIIYRYLPTYFQFLVKTGKFEKARELCLQCFTLTQDQENRALCRKALIEIRGSELRNMHHTLLHESILEDESIVIPENYLWQLRKDLQQLSII